MPRYLHLPGPPDAFIDLEQVKAVERFASGTGNVIIGGGALELNKKQMAQLVAALLTDEADEVENG
jgi:hypothetical protein